MAVRGPEPKLLCQYRECELFAVTGLTHWASVPKAFLCNTHAKTVRDNPFTTHPITPLRKRLISHGLQ